MGMAIDSYDGCTPKVHPLAFVHASAQLLGDVEVGEEASVWPTAVLRGDNGWIRFGARTNFQDGAVAHATLGTSNTTVGEECTIGHRTILHGCTVGSHCLVGMGSILLDGVELGDWCFVAAGSLLTPNRKFEAGSFILGSPAKRIRALKPAEKEWIAHSTAVYLELTRKYRRG
jgi:carbonic anhydrase/acetyltransferase-like protein (isoleucine patch superfamily)